MSYRTQHITFEEKKLILLTIKKINYGYANNYVKILNDGTNYVYVFEIQKSQ